MKKKTFLFTLFFSTLTIGLSSQDKNTATMPVLLTIPKVSQIELSGTDSKIIYIQGKGAEQYIKPSTQNKTWLNYSSIVDEKTSNVISVSLSANNLPPGLAIRLVVSESSGIGLGKLGKPSGPVYLSPFPQDIVIEIGTCFTGKGEKNGHQLTYVWEWLDKESEMPPITDDIEIAVIYTITNNK
jgi:hypothetical protein